MLVKASIFATLLIVGVASLSRVDYRQLYDEMYPVNGLRRDVLSLCHQAQPTFVRAVEADRVGCYDGMPDPVERAIGWVRTSSRLAAMRHPSPVEMAERLLVAAAAEHRINRLIEPRFTGYAALPAAVRPCEDAVTVLRVAAAAPDLVLMPAEDRLVRRAAPVETAALAALDLAPRKVGIATAPPAQPAELPILPLGGAGNSALPDNPRVTVSALLDPALGADSTGLLLPRGAAAGCKTPA